MTANPLLACDLATGWYDFTYPLSWSHKCDVAEILSDIPFISVGILTFGISTLFLVVKRVSLSAGSLILSALLAFVAAVLDLGQTLSDGMAMNATFVASRHSIQAREVLFALSVGLRFLFYWSHVAEPPRKDLSAAAAQRVQRIDLLVFQCTHEPHNGSWMRWGLPGKLVGVGLLVAIIIITTLQIVWRVFPQFHQYSNVYATDAALELLVSFVLLLKLLLNAVTLNSVDSMMVHTFSECLAPIVGLLVNIAIALGNLIFFAFTESTAGRLLQAFEVYIIVVFVMITAFLRHRDILLSTASLQGKESGDGVFTLPEPARASPFRITPPLTKTPRMSTILGIAAQNKESGQEILRRSARRSLNHVSSWLSFRISRHRSHYEDEEVKLWNAEKAKVDPPYTGYVDTELRASIVTQTFEERPELVRDTSASHMSIISALDVQSASAMSMEDSVYSCQIQCVSRADVSSSQRTIPLQAWRSPAPIPSILPSIPGAEHGESMKIPLETSPVHGPGSYQPPASAFNPRTSLNELLKQQNQLGQNAKAPWLFSTETSVNPPYSNSVMDDGSVGLTRSLSTGQRTVCSEVSLSNFPVPPGLTTPVPPLPSSSSSSIKRIRDRRVRLAATRPNPVHDTSALVLPETLASLVNSIPHTPTREGNEPLFTEDGKFCHSDSGGTQYNVTSFIGGRMFASSSAGDSVSNISEDLVTPGKSCQGSQEKPWWPTENESFRTIETGSDVKLPLFAHSSRLFQENITDEFDNQTSRSLRIIPSPEISVMDRVEEDIRRPRPLRATGSPTILLAEGVDRVQRTFVRRRPPPLAIQSYTVHDPSMSRVQVLVDD